MIFILANELGEVGTWSLEDALAIEKIAHCAFEGAHIVAVESVQVVHGLLAAPAGTFGAVTIAVLKKLAASFSFQGWLRDSSLTIAMVTTAGGAAEVSRRSGRVLTLADIRRLSLEPTTLLAENLVDAQVYAIAAKHHVAASGLRGVEVSATTRGGGGSTIVPELEEIVRRSERVCLALTDADLTWPGAGESDAARRCARLVGRATLPVGHESIPVRELENLIPPTVLLELVAEPERVDSVRRLSTLCAQVPHVRECADIKDGVAGSRVFRLPEGSPERDFLGDLLRRRHGNENRCVRNNDCERERNNGECDCVCVPKVGAVAPKFHEWLAHRSAPKALESFASPWRESWLSVGAKVFAWCCSQPRMRG